MTLSGGLGLVLMTGCPPHPQIACGAGAQAGAHHQARLDEPYNDAVTDVLFSSAYGTSNPSCASVGGLSTGSTLPFTLTSESLYLYRCWTKLADVTLPSSVQITGPARELTGNYQGTVGVFLKTVSLGGGCAGTIEIKLDAPDNRPYGSRSPTLYPPFLVTRSFKPDDPARCPPFPGADSGASSICADTWVAALSIVP